MGDAPGPREHPIRILIVDDHPVMRDGQRIAPPPPLDDVRAYAADNLARLPASLRQVAPGEGYPTEVGDALVKLAEEVDRRLASMQERQQ